MSDQFCTNGFRPSFSQRYGYAHIPAPLNPEEFTSQLRNELKFVLCEEYNKGSGLHRENPYADWQIMLRELGVEFFGYTLHLVSDSAFCLQQCCMLFLQGDFFQVIDFIENLCERIGNDQPSLPKRFSKIFERYQTPYTLIKSPKYGWIVHEVGTSQERQFVMETFAHLKDPIFATTRSHMENAGRCLTQGKLKDVVRESVMAVEACARTITKKHDFTLGKLVQKEWEKLNLPPGIIKIFQGVWEYRSDAPGVGHSEKEISQTPNPTSRDARLLYVTSCVIISYLISGMQMNSEIA